MGVCALNLSEQTAASPPRPSLTRLISARLHTSAAPPPIAAARLISIRVTIFAAWLPCHLLRFPSSPSPPHVARCISNQHDHLSIPSDTLSGGHLPPVSPHGDAGQRVPQRGLDDRWERRKEKVAEVKKRRRTDGWMKVKIKRL